MLTPSLMHHLSIVPDFRQAWKVQHQLSDILCLTVCAVICGAEGWDEIEDFGHAKLDFLRQYGDFEAGVPSHDTLARVMALVNAEQLQSAFAEWMKACHDVTEGAVVAIDGKTLRGSYCRGKGKGAIHMVSAFSAANGVVLGQVKTAEKSNEIMAIPELLKRLNLQGCLVTIDAMGCQKKIATEVLQKGADAFEAAFPMAKVASFTGDSYVTDEKNRGRQETRYHIVSEITDEFQEISYEWPGMKTVGVVMSFRQKGDGAPEIPMIRYYISSAELSAHQFAEAARQHWFVENKLHWSLDVALRDDACKIHRAQAAENLARVRHIALNYLKGEKRFKGGIRRKKKAALDETYLADILAV
ncbi:ISAs1 family transposase [Halomonas sp. 328]|uniref:ISAs1 family transposase n=1 Tax=Halomonas sp. 328 TaxID=2776704 RepID=UPI0018A76C3E|nr:ISAs1 family transposase [Halomonas sp. 328]MBF8224040.1 ISAs1 family transposase [Halomonas sp. 328]